MGLKLFLVERLIVQVLGQTPYPRPELAAFCLSGMILSSLEVNFVYLDVLILVRAHCGLLYRMPLKNLEGWHRFALYF